MSQRNDYAAGAGQTIFTFTFQIFENDEIQVYQNGLLLALGIDYTVTIDALPSIGGSITLTSGATAGDTISLVQAIPFTRLISYQTDGDWQADTVNADFNRLYTLLVQAFGTSSDPNDQISDRLLRFATSENRSGATNLIPSPSEGEMMIWQNGDLRNISIPTFAATTAPVVNNIAALKSLNVTVTQSARIEGINTSGDGGANAFYYNAASTDPDNGTTIIEPFTGGGRWLALPAGTDAIQSDAVTREKINADVAGSALAQAPSGELNVQVDSSTIEISGDALGVVDNSISNQKLSQVAQNIFKGRSTAGSGDVEDLSITQVLSMIGLSGSASNEAVDLLIPISASNQVRITARKVTSLTNTAQTFNFPTAFGAIPLVFCMRLGDGMEFLLGPRDTVTTSNFQIDRDNTIPNSNLYYIAIGLA